MASFHRNHSYFQHSFTGLPNREKLDFVISATSSICTSPIPERIRCFSSQLAIPSIDSNYLSPSFCTALSRYGSNSSDTTNRSNSHKRSRATPNLKKRHMITRSRTGKGRLLRLFNTNSNSSQNGSILCDDMTDDGVYFAGTKEDNMDDITFRDGDMLLANEFYTVNSNYTASSLLLADNVTHDDHPSSSTSNNIPEKETFNGGYSEGQAQSCHNESPKFVEGHFQMGELSQIPSPVSLILHKSTEDMIYYNNEASKEKEPDDMDMTISYYEAPPAMLVCARSWKYPPSSHVYASKILSEMKVIMHEYCIWLEKTQEARSKSSMIFVPRLSLDWPKNWTFSHN